MTHLPQDFKEFLKSLNSHDVKYLLVGGYAVGYYGYPRATVDLDVWIQVSEDNANKIVTALKSFGFDLPHLSRDLFLIPDRIIRMGVPPIRIEILTGISGMKFAQCYEFRVRGKIDGIDINIIRLEDLKTNKHASGRAKDLNDLENLP